MFLYFSSFFLRLDRIQKIHVVGLEMSISVLVAVAKEMALVLQVNRTSARGVPEVQSFRGLQLYPVQIDGFFMTHFTPKKTATFGNWPKEKVQLCQTSNNVLQERWAQDFVAQKMQLAHDTHECTVAEARMSRNEILDQGG